MTRYLNSFIQQDLTQKMVFIGGPRQVGKTTLAQNLAQQHYANYIYFNWDNDWDQRRIRQQQWPNNTPLVIFDELHKYPHWKQWLKGLYDKKPEHQQYLVTGSARLNVYKKGGDSLLGRYHYWRLHPFTLDELPYNISYEQGYQRLMKLGGFPEPFLGNDARQAKRWHTQRLNKLLREDVRDLSMVHQIKLLEVYINALRERVGSSLVHSNLAQDLQISPTTSQNWLALIENLYIAFAIQPLIKNIPRAIQKPPKVYFYDNGDVIGDDSIILENLVATHLLKQLHFREDYYGERCQLHYIRDRNGREVDFATVIDGQVDALIEVKLSDESPSTGLKYYTNRLSPNRAVQIVGNNRHPFDKGTIHVTNPIDYFRKGPWHKA